MYEKLSRIAFVGPSGIGKTTLAKAISKEYGIPFISGSMSDIVPSTAIQTHYEMMQKPPEKLAMQNWQALNKRNKILQDRTSFVTDRSFVDAAAYYWYELSKEQPECEIEHFFSTANHCMRLNIDLAIFLPLNLENMMDWEVENNNKRITNRYFQVQISGLMGDLLADWEIPTLVVTSLDYNERMEQIRQYLDIWLKK